MQYPQEAVLATRPVSWSDGDLTFSGELQPIDELTWEEKYVVLGLEPGTAPIGVTSLPWNIIIFGAVEKLEALNGYIPEQLTPEVLRQIPGFAKKSDEQLDVYRSPLTGEWPRLRQETQSPGDLYVRRLTDQEIEQFAELSPQLHRQWIEGYDEDVRSGSGEIPVKMGPIYYVRIYGWSAPIYEDFTYVVSPR